MVVDDHPVMRAATRRFLEASGRIRVVHEAGSIEEAVEVEGEIDVVVLDLSLPGQSGIDGAGLLLQRYHGVKILMLTVYADPAIARRALDNGAHGFVTKGCAPAELVEAVMTVSRGHRYVPDDIARAMPGRQPRAVLSPREVEVLRLLIDGLRVGEIADSLGISLKTASTFKSRIHAKTGCASLDQLIGFAVQHQLLPTAVDGSPITRPD